jgi:hypothetical protein
VSTRKAKVAGTGLKLRSSCTGAQSRFLAMFFNSSARASIPSRAFGTLSRDDYSQDQLIEIIFHHYLLFSTAWPGPPDWTATLALLGGPLYPVQVSGFASMCDQFEPYPGSQAGRELSTRFTPRASAGESTWRVSRKKRMPSLPRRSRPRTSELAAPASPSLSPYSRRSESLSLSAASSLGTVCAIRRVGSGPILGASVLEHPLGARASEGI